MKKLILFVILTCGLHVSFAQKKSDSLKTVTSIAMQLWSVEVEDFSDFALWLTYERKLAERFTLHSRLGFRNLFWGIQEGSFLTRPIYSHYTFSPRLEVEPRFYYNFNKRTRKGKKTLNNSANYLAVTNGFVPGFLQVTSDNVGHPDWQVTYPDGRQDTPSIYFIEPKWGIRRAIMKHFKLEFDAGYGFYFNRYGMDGSFNLDLRFGYTF